MDERWIRRVEKAPAEEASISGETSIGAEMRLVLEPRTGRKDRKGKELYLSV